MKTPIQAANTQTGAVPPQEVATAAYFLWEHEGRPTGREQEFWLRAESQLRINRNRKLTTAENTSLPQAENGSSRKPARL